MNKDNVIYGVNLIKKGLFLSATIDILNHGRDRKSLELVRLGVNNKFKKKMNSRYSYVIHTEKTPIKKINKTVKSDVIWIVWFQGINNAPDLVKKCYESLQHFLSDKRIIVIDSTNMNQYISLPDIILKKRENGEIKDAHFSDIVRAELLATYGGTWMDATLLLTGNDFPKSFFDSEIFFYQKIKPGSNGDGLGVSSWFIHAKPEQEIIMNTREMLLEYWKKNKTLKDYFLFHYFLSISRDYYESSNRQVPKFSNSSPHLLLLELNDKYEENRFNDICKMTSIHKLSYKDLPKQGDTMYDYIINHYQFKNN